jgi:Ca-activated chloride channel family protein
MDNILAYLHEFHFIRPWWLLGLLMVAALYLLSRRNRGHSSIDDLVDAHLQAVVVDTPKQQGPRTAGQLLLLLGGLLSIALAGPSWQRLPQPLFQLQQGRVLVLSLSTSMDERDLKPSRLKRAKFKLVDLLASAPGVLNGLVGFAGEAFVVAPLSDDQDTIINLLQALDTQTLPVQGVRAERGLQKAAQLLQQVNLDVGEVILVADQVSPLAVNEAAKLLRSGVSVSVLEVATAQASQQRTLFKSIAKAGGGIYTRLHADDKDIARLNKPLTTLLSRANAKTMQSQRSADQWRDVGPYLLIPILLLSSLLFRKGWLVNTLSFGLPLLVLASLPIPVRAFELQNLWQRASQMQWQAGQAYHQQDYTTALEGFEKDASANGYYNQANALAKMQEFEQAIAAYDEALKLQADFEDAQYNRELVKAALEQAQDQANLAADEQAQQNAEDKQKQNEEGDGQNKQDQGNASNSRVNENNKDAQSYTGDPGGQAGESSQNRRGVDSLTEQGEDEQALQMMLRQVPDDPGALLRRKFARQYADQQALRPAQ